MTDAPAFDLPDRIAACELCRDRFAATATRHRPNPVVWMRPGTPIVVAGQAPGIRVHEAGKPFFDRSGDRLRDWMGIGPERFYDRALVTSLPMAFCFPGYDARGSDLPPPPLCARTWRQPAVDWLGEAPLILLIGGYAQRWHLGRGTGNVTQTVAGWRDHAPRIFPLPHPSWRNTAWLKKNPWFARDLVPALRARVQEVLNDR